MKTRAGSLAALLVVLAAACASGVAAVYQPAPPQTVLCLEIITSPDSIAARASGRPCGQLQEGDPVMIWRFASNHGRCDMLYNFDFTTGQVGTAERNCSPAPEWLKSLPTLPRADGTVVAPQRTE